MKLCMMTYTMGRQGFGVKDFIRTAVECKLEGIDWITTYGHDPRELKKMSDDAGLKVACHTFMLDRFVKGQHDWLDQAKSAIADAIILGAPIVMIPTPAHPEITDRNAWRQSWISALKQIKPIADNAGVVLTVENFPGATSPFITAADFLEANKAIPGLMLTYDCGNAASGEDPVESFRDTASCTVHAHLKDWFRADTPKEGYRLMLDGRYYYPAPIGEGDIGIATVWRAMKQAGYNGYVNIEYEGNEVSADIAIARAVDYLRNID